VPAVHALHLHELALERVAACEQRRVLLADSEKRLVLGWPKRSKLAHAFRWEYSYEMLKLAQLLG
jgi:hypothetical protein